MPLFLAALIFAGCSGQGPQKSDVSIENAATEPADYYLQQMQQSADDSRLNWQLLAIRALLQEGKITAAAKQLVQLPRERSTSQQQEILLLQAQYQALTDNTSAASSLLQQIDVNVLSPHQQSRYYPLVIATQQGIPSLTLLRAYIAQQTLLTDPVDKQRNIDATWQVLTRMSQEQVSRLVINANENILQGWLDLLNVWITNRHDPELLKTGIRDWQRRYPHNPAAKMLPVALSNGHYPMSTAKIALLLPLTGQAKVFADAIQQGFNDAKNGTLNAASEQNQPTSQGQTQDTQTATDSAQPDTGADPIVNPADTAIPVQPDNTRARQQNSSRQIQTAPPSATTQVQLYDTSSQPMAELLAKAQQDGASLVVGPLLKDNVKALADNPTTLNVLALNEPELIQNHANICYFALSPEDEARDAAHHMWEQGKRQPLLLLPRSELGDRVSNAFALEWQRLGGSIVQQQRFGSAGELKQSINNGTGIQLSGIPVTVQQPPGVSVAGPNPATPATETQTEVPSGGDSLDSIYIVATQGELQLIKPMIAMRISSRDNTAIYASSRSYQAGTGPDFRLEMEGLQFSDAPLISGANPALLAQAASRFHNDYSLVRLYAMGIDAWTLANYFNQMRQMPGFRLQGNSGLLSTTPDCAINRKLTWNQYHQGQIVPVR